MNEILTNIRTVQKCICSKNSGAAESVLRPNSIASVPLFCSICTDASWAWRCRAGTGRLTSWWLSWSGVCDVCDVRGRGLHGDIRAVAGPGIIWYAVNTSDDLVGILVDAFSDRNKIDTLAAYIGDSAFFKRSHGPVIGLVRQGHLRTTPIVCYSRVEIVGPLGPGVNPIRILGVGGPGHRGSVKG
jgi:hypothetical protein